MRSPTSVSIASTPSITSTPNPRSRRGEPGRGVLHAHRGVHDHGGRDLPGDDAHAQVELRGHVVVEVEQVPVRRGCGVRLARILAGPSQRAPLDPLGVTPGHARRV